jgi:hypothetical protein
MIAVYSAEIRLEHTLRVEPFYLDRYLKVAHKVFELVEITLRSSRGS